MRPTGRNPQKYTGCDFSRDKATIAFSIKAGVHSSTSENEQPYMLGRKPCPLQGKRAAASFQLTHFYAVIRQASDIERIE
jgi:hypothetical protein